MQREGPCTGLEIRQEIDDLDPLLIWKTCKTSPALQVLSLGKRYLRLDRNLDGYARLSPSILREFFTYSVVGLSADPDPLEARCKEIADRIREISRQKFDLAQRMVSEIMDEFAEGASEPPRTCSIIAGDIVYDMAHDVPRPERGTGKLVKGSDIDLVVVVSDDFSDSSINRLDGLIYQKKYRMLIDPAVNQELDYIIKRLGRVREQARFDDFKKMVAIKILHEGLLLHGSEDLYRSIKTILQENELPQKLDELEMRAEESRSRAEESILDGSLHEREIRETHLFYPAEEFEEFE